ncbi:MAG: glycosyltransferase family 2 protein [Microbacteriaceae bacterium]|nr:glycosyltransferase family 2 protein [Microbacteriaceae bacterium]
MRISVALCTHNGAEFVGEQVQSILRQVPAPDELVLGDDASSDDSVAIVERLVAEHRAAGGTTELVVRRHDPALGVVANFADALGAVRGEFVALSDQDDVWRDGRLARALAAFDADPELLLVHSDARLVDAQGAPTGLALLQALEATPGERAGLEHGDAFATLMRRNLVTGATVVLRRDLLDRGAPFPEGWVHDEWLAVLAAASGGLRLIPEPLIDYRQHGANQIGARRPTMADRVAKLREPREPRATRLAHRTGALVERLEELERRGVAVRPDALEAARARLAFEDRRRALPVVRVARVPRILAAAARGEYARYARGAIDVLRDLVQPARKDSR